MSGMSFVLSELEEIEIKRRSNASNVFIIETQDSVKVKLIREEAKRKVIFRAQRYLELNLQLMVVKDEKGSDIQLQPSGFVKQLYALLLETPTVLVIRYVFSQRHAEIISDLLFLVAQDPAIYSVKYMSQDGKERYAPSTVLVFTSNASLFPISLLKQCVVVTIVSSTYEERKSYAQKLVEEITSLGLRAPSISEDIIQASSGLTLHEFETALLESFYRYKTFDVKTITRYKIEILKQYGLIYIEPTRGFESVGGYQYLKEYVKRNIITPLRNPETAKYYGLPLPRGIVLYGLPGTGKSWFAKALAKEIGLPMVSINPSDFLRGIVGETEARVRQVTQLLESLAPVVVFIDELDQLALARGKAMITDSGVSRRLTNMLLEWLGDENRKSFIVGATNYIEDIDEAFLRPGRIDEVIVVLPPDYRARLEILKVHTSVIRKVPLSPDVSLESIAMQTYMFTGAELEKLVLDSVRLAMYANSKVVRMEHFEQVLKTMKINVEEREQQLKRMIDVASKLSTCSKSFLEQAWVEFKKSEETVYKGRLATWGDVK